MNPPSIHIVDLQEEVKPPDHIEEDDDLVLVEKPASPPPKISKTYVDSLRSWFVDSNHPSKQHKYRNVLQEYVYSLNTLGISLEKETDRLVSRINENAIFDPNGLDYQVFLILKILLHPSTPQEILNIDPSFPNYSDARMQYRTFVLKLREIVDSPEYKSIAGLDRQTLESKNPQALYCRDIIRKLCHVRWGNTHLFSYLKEITDLTIAAYNGASVEFVDDQPLNEENFGAILDLRNRAIKHAPEAVKKPKLALQMQKFWGAMQLQDYTLFENTPYVRETFFYKNAQGAVQPIVYMRHGSPTTPGSFLPIIGGMISRNTLGVDVPSGEQIASDYEEFLRYQEENNHSVLYAIHQRKNFDAIENESERTRQILNLQEIHSNFYAFVQALEGALFERRDSYKNANFRELKAALVKEFTENKPDSSCCLPKILQRDNHYKTIVLTKLLDDVQRIFFAGKDEVDSLLEWQTFILIFYVMQKIDLKFRLGKDQNMPVSSYVTACKDFLDRGGLMALVEDILHDYWLNKQNDLKALEERLYNILGAPILVKKKEIIEHRLQPGIELCHYLCDYFKRNPQKLAEWQNYKFGDQDWKIERNAIEKRPNQTACPTMQSAETLQEAEGYLTALLVSNRWDWIQKDSIIEENLRIYRNGGSYRKDRILHQMNRDMKGQANTLITLNGKQYDTAEGMLAHMETQYGEKLALEILALSQQGIRADLVIELSKILNSDRLHLQVAQQPVTKSPDIFVRIEISTEEGIQIKIGQQFILKAVNPENGYTYREKPYASIQGHLKLMLSPNGDKMAYWNWNLLNVTF